MMYSNLCLTCRETLPLSTLFQDIYIHMLLFVNICLWKVLTVQEYALKEYFLENIANVLMFPVKCVSNDCTQISAENSKCELQYISSGEEGKKGINVYFLIEYVNGLW